ncbi:MAG: hypothetical protein AAFV98_12370 [Chloroflexota bacterium]
MAKYPCRCCGLEQVADMWNPRSHAICACCGIEMGHEDDDLIIVTMIRRRWLIKGGGWLIEEKQPIPWTMKELGEQLKNVPMEWWHHPRESKS